MSNLYRKCAKCGESPNHQQGTTVHRFLKPGRTNTWRARAWAQWCFPEQDWSSDEALALLYKSHKVVCSNHFKDADFTSFPNKRHLNRMAIPEDIMAASSSQSVALPTDLTPDQLRQAIEQEPAHFEVVAATSQPVASTSREVAAILQPIASTSRAAAAISQPLASTSRTAATISQPTASTSRVAAAISQPLASTSRTAATISQSTASTSRVAAAISQPLASTSRIAASISQPTASTSWVAAAISQPLASTSQAAAATSHPNALVSQAVNTSAEAERLKKLTAKCKSRAKTIWRLKKQMKKLKKGVILQNLVEDENIMRITKLSPSTITLIQCQIKNSKRPKKGYRWSTDEKIMALTLYKKSPACYRLLKRMFCLPSQSTLKKLLNLLPFQCGINEQIFSTMKKICSDRTALHNICSLSFDEMSIRKNIQYNSRSDCLDGYEDHGTQGRSQKIASHALVFMLTGIVKRWKQPVAYYFSGDSISSTRLTALIKEVITKCQEAGLKIVSSVCDMGGANIKALENLGVTEDQPSFSINGEEIIAMFDAPHLLKCTRNNLINYNIQWNEINQTSQATAKWSNIVAFHNLESEHVIKNNFVFAPALKKQHLEPNTKQKMKVSLAAQLFSHSVAAGMLAKVAKGELPADAAATANFVEQMDSLFDSVNADSVDLRRGKKYSTNVTSQSDHISFWKKMRAQISSWVFIGAKSPPPCKRGWLITLRALDLLWSKLSQQGLRSLQTRRLCQDGVENLFGLIRSNCGSNPNPTTQQFTAALKTSIISGLSHSTANRTNCEADNSVALDNLKVFLTTETANVTDPPTTSSLNYNKLSEDDILNIERSVEEGDAEAQACCYVTGFILKKINRNNCDRCREQFHTETQELCHIFTTFKEYGPTDRLQYPSAALVSFVQNCSTLIFQLIEKKPHYPALYGSILSFLKDEASLYTRIFRQCEEHFSSNLDLVYKSIFHICVNRWCKIQNRQFSEEASRKALAKKIDILQHK